MNELPVIDSVRLFDTAIVFKDLEITPVRQVKRYELELSVEDGGISYINNVPHKILKNNFVCTKPGAIRNTRTPHKCYAIHFSVNNTEIQSLLDSLPDVFQPVNPSEYKKIFKKMLEVYENPILYSEINLQNHLFEMFSLLVAERRVLIVSGNRKKKNEDAVQRAFDFIDENISSDITLDDIANHVHLSKIYFHKIFTVSAGVTPHQYLINKRIANAKNLFLTTDKSFADIAQECGFTSQSYMNYIFKKECGMTPTEFIKQFGLQWGK